jgi:hypothetical protein
LVTIQPLWAPQFLTAVAVVYYTATSRTQIDKITVSNPQAGTPYSVQIWWVPASGSDGPSNNISPTRQLQPLESWDVWQLIGHTLGVGDTIQAAASVDGVLAFFGSGRLMTP